MPDRPINVPESERDYKTQAKYDARRRHWVNKKRKKHGLPKSSMMKMKKNTKPKSKDNSKYGGWEVADYQLWRKLGKEIWSNVGEARKKAKKRRKKLEDKYDGPPHKK